MRGKLRGGLGIAIAGLALLAPLAGQAETLRVGNPSPQAFSFIPIDVGLDQGIFKKHGLDAEMVLIGINSNIPAAILSNSIQIGGPTSTVFLQAVDGGLDLVAVAGASIMNPSSNTNIAACVRNGITIKEPKDFAGKKVGAPGLGAFLHVLFVKWLVEKGVDPKSVNFVEVTFPTMADIIKSGGAALVLSEEPFVPRLVTATLGQAGALYGTRLQAPRPPLWLAS